MSDPVIRARRPVSYFRMFITALVLLAVGIAIYLKVVKEPEVKHLKLALVTWTEDPFWEPLIRGAQESAKDANIDLTIVRSKPTVEEQTKHIKELIASGIDGIAISPNDAKEQLAVLNEAADKMPVVTFDTDAPESRRRRFIGIDNYAAGRFLADELREAMPDGGSILITVGSVTMQHGRDRRQGLIDDLLERGFDRTRASEALDKPIAGPKYTVVTTVIDGADPAKAVVALTEALKAHPEVKGVVGLFSYSAPAALEAAKAVGREGQLKVVGFDESSETQAAIESGAIHSSILQDTYHAGQECITVLADEARGVTRGPAEQSPVLTVRIDVMTAKNIADLRAAGAIRQPAAK